MPRKPKPINPAALSLRDAAKLLTAALPGAPALTREQLAADVAAGAPTNADGTLHLVHYAAWLLSEPQLAQAQKAVVQKT